MCPPQLSTLMLRLRGAGNDVQQQLLDAVNARARGKVSSTVVDGAVWLRICVQSLHTHAQHVEELVDAVLDAARRLELARAARPPQCDVTAIYTGVCATPAAAGVGR